MALVTKAVISVTRPIYQRLFERPLWWFLARVKAFFFAETLDRLQAIEGRLAALEKPQGIEEHFRHLQATNAAQWDAIEKLLIGMFRQPEARICYCDVKPDARPGDK